MCLTRAFVRDFLERKRLKYIASNCPQYSLNSPRIQAFRPLLCQDILMYSKVGRLSDEGMTAIGFKKAFRDRYRWSRFVTNRGLVAV